MVASLTRQSSRHFRFLSGRQLRSPLQLSRASASYHAIGAKIVAYLAQLRYSFTAYFELQRRYLQVQQENS